MDLTLCRILEELKLKKIKQKDLANFLDLKENAIGNWKSGLNQSYLKYLHAIAEFLDVSVEYLKGETDIKKTPDEPKLTEGERIWLNLYHQLSTETRDVFVNMANAFENLPADRQKFLLDAIRFAVENQK